MKVENFEVEIEALEGPNMLQMRGRATFVQDQAPNLLAKFGNQRVASKEQNVLPVCVGARFCQNDAPHCDRSANPAVESTAS